MFLAPATSLFSDTFCVGGADSSSPCPLAVPSLKLTPCAAVAADTGTGGGTTPTGGPFAGPGTADVGIGGGTTTGAVTAADLEETALGGGGITSGADRAGGVPTARGEDMEEEGAADVAAMVARLLGDEMPVLRVDLARGAAPAAAAAAATAAAGAGAVVAATGGAKAASRCT